MKNECNFVPDKCPHSQTTNALYQQWSENSKSKNMTSSVIDVVLHNYKINNQKKRKISFRMLHRANKQTNKQQKHFCFLLQPVHRSN